MKILHHDWDMNITHPVIFSSRGEGGCSLPALHCRVSRFHIPSELVHCRVVPILGHSYLIHSETKGEGTLNFQQKIRDPETKLERNFENLCSKHLVLQKGKPRPRRERELLKSPPIKPKLQIRTHWSVQIPLSIPWNVQIIIPNNPEWRSFSFWLRPRTQWRKGSLQRRGRMSKPAESYISYTQPS